MIEYEEVTIGGWTLIVGGQKEMTTGSITGLRPLTHYDIRVAAVNSAGIGPFTNSSNASTSGITEHTHTSIYSVGMNDSTSWCVNATPFNSGLF